MRRRERRFFLTLNGRALIQRRPRPRAEGSRLPVGRSGLLRRQVAENEFDIVENCYVADVWARRVISSPSTASRTAKWALGGGDPLCSTRGP